MPFNVSMWSKLIFLGANTLIAYGCMSEALKYIPANKVSMIITLNPIITIATMELLKPFQLQWPAPEKTTFIGFFGACLLVLGVILSIKKLAKKLQFRIRESDTLFKAKHVPY
jgi:drug/metabolite transporter (DMT)-like permease